MKQEVDAIIKFLGGTTAVANLCEVKPPSVTEWRVRGVPPAKCPAIERASNGAFPCEEVRPDVQWARLPDKDWRWHKKGRPVIDVTKAAA